MNPSLFELVKWFPRNGFANCDFFYSIPTELNPDRIISTGHPDIEDFSSKSDISSSDVSGCSSILHLNQVTHYILWFSRFPNLQMQIGFLECFWRIQTVNSANRSNSYHIRTSNKACNSRESFLFDSLIHLQFFIDVQVTIRQVSLWLVVIVVTNEVFYSILWKQLAHLLP